MRTYKIEVTSAQNRTIEAKCRHALLRELAWFGSLTRDFTYWVTDEQLDAVTACLGMLPRILFRSAD